MGKMKERMKHFTAKNPNPVLSVEKDDTILFSNEAAKPLLIEWGVEIGEKIAFPYRRYCAKGALSE